MVRRGVKLLKFSVGAGSGLGNVAMAEGKGSASMNAVFCFFFLLPQGSQAPPPCRRTEDSVISQYSDLSRFMVFHFLPFCS